MQVRSLGWEDALEEGMATHASILAWRIPKERGTWRATVHGVTKELDMTERMSTHISSRLGHPYPFEGPLCLSFNIAGEEGATVVRVTQIQVGLPHRQ